MFQLRQKFEIRKAIYITFILPLFVAISVGAEFAALAQDSFNSSERLKFNSLEDLPDSIGVAGPIVGVDGKTILVAGGANFAKADDPKLWELPKVYHDQIWLMNRTGDSKDDWSWTTSSTKLSKKIGYSAVVSIPSGVLVMGGEDATGPQKRAFLLSIDRSKSPQTTVIENDLGIPDLPLACTGCAAAVIDNYVYLVAGQVLNDDGSKNASRIIWRLSLTRLKKEMDGDINGRSDYWEEILSWNSEDGGNGSPKMFALVSAQNDGFRQRLYVIGGRHFASGTDKSDLYNLKFTKDSWSFDPTIYDSRLYDAKTKKYRGKNPWKRIAEPPVPLTAGTVVPFGPAHLIVPGYATGEALKDWLDSKTPQPKYDHPGFPKTAYAYHTITDSWTEFGKMPANQVTTPAITLGDEIFLISGEVRPRVRTNKVWRIAVPEKKSTFGWFNMSVVVIYLLAMVGVGVYFTFRNKSTDDYFRGGKNIPWWAAGCSIFATMLSSITYMAIPAKAFAQDWVYSVGNGLILCVAPIAIYIALPFFRRIDATSAYEYLEMRFNRTARLIGSGSFSLFHIFRMAVVLALAALALSSVTPLSPHQCVIVMGLLSIIYCTLGGIEAVIWTDTIQTVVLICGALFCLLYAFYGSDAGSLTSAMDSGKFHLANVEFGSNSFMFMAIWVVVLGGLGQNISSYTADQAVVQRYMTTPSASMAARSIWLNGFMAIPATLIFFGMGTAFWMFYRSHPEQLDPTIGTDRIMPLFISQQLPIGIAGLVVAGIFAAAQSTVSTSMNSGATTIVTDFLKPGVLSREGKLDKGKSTTGNLWLARLITLLFGVFGTAVGLLFVDPKINSLFDQFVGFLGMFLGVLAGLFALGATTRRANGRGSLIGAFTAILVMITIVLAAKDKSILGFEIRAIFDSLGTKIYRVSGYLYAFIGIGICYVVGFLASFLFPDDDKDLTGLTLWDRAADSEPS